MKTAIVLLNCFVFSIFILKDSNAQNTDTLQSIFVLDSVEVTATQIPTSVSKTGKSITVINRQELKAMPITSVDELLRYLPGVNVNTRQAFGVQNDIGIRGSTFAQVLIVVDNVRLNDPLTGHFNNNFPVSMSEIEQIEIVRGPSGASFGADAVGGLIHIKTKHYNASIEENDTLQLSARVGIGQNNHHFSDLNIWHKNNKLLVTGGIQTNIARGETLPNPNFGISGGDSLFNNYFNVRTYTAALSYFLNHTYKLNFRTSIDQRDFSAKYFYTRSTFDESEENINSNWYQLGIQRNLGKQVSQLNIGLKNTKDEFAFNPAFAVNEHKTRLFQIGLNHSYEYSNQVKATAGLLFLNKKIKSNDRGNHQNSSIALFTDALYQFNYHLTANGSLRLEYDGNFGFELLPQLSLSYLGGHYALRASIGKSIRAADFTERFVSTQINNLTPGRNIGNPDLEAERSWSFEIGGDYHYDTTLKGSATLFHRRSTNLIDYIYTNSSNINNVENLLDNEFYFRANNISESNTTGLELSAKKDWLLFDLIDVDLQAGYTFLNTTSSGDTPSKYIANHPRHNVSAILEAGMLGFRINLNANLINRTSDFSEAIGASIKKSYFISNLRFSYLTFQENLSVFLQIHNFTNTQYSEILGAQMPGSWVMLGIEGRLAR